MTSEAQPNSNECSSSEPFEEVRPLEDKDQKLVTEYLKTGIPTDRLANSEALSRITQLLREAGDTRTEQELWRRLVNLRKAGRLPRLAG